MNSFYSNRQNLLNVSLVHRIISVQQHPQHHQRRTLGNLSTNTGQPMTMGGGPPAAGLMHGQHPQESPHPGQAHHPGVGPRQHQHQQQHGHHPHHHHSPLHPGQVGGGPQAGHMPPQHHHQQAPVGGTTVIGPGGQPIVVPHSPGTGAHKIIIGPNVAGVGGPPFSPSGRPPQQRPQFYGHNPNLKLPAELFLLGCTFFIVEYDDQYEHEIPDWTQLIRQHGGEIEPNYCPRVTHVLCRTQRHGVVMQAIRDAKRCVTAYWLNDTVLKRSVQPPWQALHLPMPSTFGTQRPALRHIVTLTGFEGEERARVKRMVEEAGAKLTPYLSKHNTVLICRRPEGAKWKRARDWSVPVVNVVWLSDILLGNLSGMSQFESSKYQQFGMAVPLRIDYLHVLHLMSEFWRTASICITIS